ncbi:MAG: molybdopterin-dependent oxidoreductase [Armatimonadetes bacterium]|nr:molybdopterin-dependent oxidoreductase [Armatimonadota bacterium]MDW8028649.1 molybdopterin-dependent oxidoreductase [Armatimonadota bacterium]
MKNMKDLINEIKVGRRGFFKWGAIAGTAATLPLWIQKLMPSPIGMREPRVKPQGEEHFFPAVCSCCDAGCGALVRVIEGQAVGIKGNPNHPISQGALCPKGFALTQELYHPDRVKTPLKRQGERGSNNWKPISWDEAVSEIAGKLKEIRSQGEPNSLLILTNTTRNFERLLLQRFATAFGTPNFVEIGWDFGKGMVDAAHAMMGTEFVIDLEDAAFVISFGFDWLQSFTSPVEATRAYAKLRRGRPDRRIRIVQVEPHMSVTGIKADEWIAVKPYTESALALGMAHIIVAEGLYDEEFVSTKTFGFEDFKDAEGNSHRGFKSIVLEDYEPEKVSKFTGVKVETIRRLAYEFAEKKPSIALADRTRFYDQMAVLALNALVGSIGVKGGILPLPAFSPFMLPPCPQDEIARNGLSKRRIDKSGENLFPLANSAAEQIPDVLLGNNTPYQVKALILHRANPVFLSPDLNRWIETIRKIPFVVSMTSFMDETSIFADIILPLHATLESWQGIATRTLKGTPVLSVSKPVVEPLYDTKNAGDVVISLAKAIGGTVAQAFPWESVEQAMKESLKGLFESGRGELISEPPVEEEDSWIEEETKPTLDKWFRNIAAVGGWVDKKAAITPKFNTPSGKFEFYSQILKQKLGDQANDLACLPHVEHPEFLGELKKEVRLSTAPPAGNGTSEPMHLYLFVPLVFQNGEGAHLPYLQGMAGSYLSERRWHTWIEINPETAKELGLREDEFIWVISPIGRIRARVRFYVGVPKDVVAMPLGLGHTAYGRWAEGVGSNPASIVPKILDEVTGQPLWQLTLVRLAKGGRV